MSIVNTVEERREQPAAPPIHLHLTQQGGDQEEDSPQPPLNPEAWAKNMTLEMRNLTALIAQQSASMSQQGRN